MQPERRKTTSAPNGRVDSSRPLRHACRMSRRDVKSLAQAVKDVRSELGLSQREFAERGELSPLTVQRIEAERVEPRTKTYAGLDKAARWPPGTARAIAEDGGKRPPLSADLPSQTRTNVRYYDAVTDLLDERAVIERMVELLPSIRRRHGATRAEQMRRIIIDLAEEADLLDFASSALDSLDMSRRQLGQ